MKTKSDMLGKYANANGKSPGVRLVLIKCRPSGSSLLGIFLVKSQKQNHRTENNALFSPQDFSTGKL